MVSSSSSFSSSSSPSSSSDLAEDLKRHLLSCLPPNPHILATAGAKVYHMPFSSRAKSWTWTGLSGTLVFGRTRSSDDSDCGSKTGQGDSFDRDLWFRLVDPSKGLVWQHQIPEQFDYNQDKPFFHQFSGKSRMFGFRFDDDTEAIVFLQEVKSSVITRAMSPRKIVKSERLLKRLTSAMISRPTAGSFKHVAHVGFDTDGRIEASDHIDSEWTMALQEGNGTFVSSVQDDDTCADAATAGALTASETSASNHGRSTIPPTVALSNASIFLRRAPWRKFTL